MRSLLLLILVGCAAENVEGPPPRESEAPPPKVAPAPAPVVVPAAVVAPAAPAPSGAIRRAALLAVLDKSPGAFLAHVDVSPRFAGGRFVGWRVVRFFPGDDRFAGVELSAGDVVRSVNGLPIEKPEQLMVVWQALRTAAALEVLLERNGTQRLLRWPIAD